MTDLTHELWERRTDFSVNIASARGQTNERLGRAWTVRCFSVRCNTETRRSNRIVLRVAYTERRRYIGVSTSGDTSSWLYTGNRLELHYGLADEITVTKI